MRLRPRNLRTRLTLWYVAMLAMLLVLAWGGTCALLFLQLRNQLDHFAIQEVETVEGLFYFTPDGQLHMREDYHNHPESKEVLDRYLEVLTLDGTILLRNERLGGRTLDGELLAREGVGGYSERSSRLSDDTPVRLVSRVHVLEGRQILIRLAHSEEPLLVRMKDLLLASLVVLPMVLAAPAWLATVWRGVRCSRSSRWRAARRRSCRSVSTRVWRTTIRMTNCASLRRFSTIRWPAWRRRLTSYAASPPTLPMSCELRLR
jgi:hypothetical protein